MPPIRLTLLGGFQLLVDERPETGFRSDKARALLAYVAAQPERPHDRAALAALLWPEIDDSAARANLRNVLSNLRGLLPEGLTITRRTVLFDPAHIDVDLLRFRALLDEDPAAAVALVQGEFLSGLALPDAAPFGEWHTLEQERIHRQLMAALDRLQAAAQERQEWQALAGAAQRQLELVPWHETAHRALMRALAGRGDYSGALAQYEQARAVLRDEMGLEPAPETKALLAELTAAMPAVTNLPLLPERLIGREAEAAALVELLPHRRLVTLLGPGGIGKSRLALDVGRRLLPEYEDGVWLVGLAGVAGEEGLYGAIGAALGVEFHGTMPLREQLGVALAQEERLIILDNFEHLAALGEGLLPLLEMAPRLRLLVTSRARLGLAAERVLLLEGLSPAAGLALFAQRARRVIPGFTLSAEQCLAVDRIHELVEGLPLGLELAAIWIEHFTCAEIADSIAESKSFLEGTPRRGDERHHSLSAVFDHSWRLLAPREQRALAQLSIFRGEFGREAALAVTDAGLTDLSALLGKSLVRRAGAGRYDLHEVIRDFAAERALEWPRELGTTGTAEAFRHYYLTQVQQGYAERLALRRDVDNIRAAWLDTIAAADRALLVSAAEGFGGLLRGLGRLSEGASLLEAALDGAEGDPAAALTVQLIPYYSALYGSQRVIALAEPALGLTEEPRLRTQLHGLLARELSETGSWPLAAAQYARQEEAARQTGDKLLLANALRDHAFDQAILFAGDFREAIDRLETALALLEDEPEAVDARSETVKALVMAQLRYGNYAEALRYARLYAESAAGLGHAIEEIDAQLNLGLSHIFAGQYAAAVDYTEAGLQLAEEVGDREGTGLLQANLCLAYRGAGELAQSRAYGEVAVPLLAELGIKRMEGQARNRLGHTLAAQAAWTEADAMYGAALETWRELDNPNSYEALAGRAVTAQRLGRAEEALQHVEQVLTFAQGETLLRVVEPVLMLLNCATVLRENGDAQRAQAVLDQAEAWIDTISARNDDPAVHESYRYNPPAHRALWEWLGRSGG